MSPWPMEGKEGGLLAASGILQILGLGIANMQTIAYIVVRDNLGREKTGQNISWDLICTCMVNRKPKII